MIDSIEVLVGSSHDFSPVINFNQLITLHIPCCSTGKGEVKRQDFCMSPVCIVVYTVVPQKIN